MKTFLPSLNIKMLKGGVGMQRNQKGFTLIELLIVIVIIGILASVLISVIDPTSQQNRARDAGIEAALNKTVLATEGFISAYGGAPDEVQFLNQFKTGTVSDAAATCALAGGFECFFTVTGNKIPGTCLSGLPTWFGTGTADCAFRYEANDPLSNGEFQIYAKSAGLEGRIFRFKNYSSDAGQIMHCDAASVDADCISLTSQ